MNREKTDEELKEGRTLAGRQNSDKDNCLGV
jgi:hypothetical protein